MSKTFLTRLLTRVALECLRALVKREDNKLTKQDSDNVDRVLHK